MRRRRPKPARRQPGCATRSSPCCIRSCPLSPRNCGRAPRRTPRDSLLVITAWPDLADIPRHAVAHAEMRWIIDLVSGVRSVRSEMNVPPAAKIKLVLKNSDPHVALRLERNRDVIQTLARLESVEIADAIPHGSAQFVVGESVAGLPLGDVIDFARERTRLEKELQKAESEIARVRRQAQKCRFRRPRAGRGDRRAEGKTRRGRSVGGAVERGGGAAGVGRAIMPPPVRCDQGKEKRKQKAGMAAKHQSQCAQWFCAFVISRESARPG